VRRLHEDAGAGLISSVAGVTVFLAFLLFAVQILVHLFATTYVNAAAFEAARIASGADQARAATARARGLETLGDFAQRVSVFDVTVGDDQVRVRVTATSPALLPRMFGRVLGTDSIDRSVVLRRERVQCADC